jgi:Domain of unknown function (DUF4111)
MSDTADAPTPYPDVNALLAELLASVRAVLANHFVGMYLDGSLTSGAFDQDSDIDFVVVTDVEISAGQFSALQAMHARLAAIDSQWAIQMEGSYLSQHAVRRYEPTETLHANIERGPDERLKMAEHGRDWAVHRSMLREHGITLAGPAPHTLINPVAPGELRQGVLEQLHEWAARMLESPSHTQRGYQSYVILTLCRMLYTLENGSVISKPAAARWAADTLGERWAPLIERAWEGRHNPGLATSAEDVTGTVAFIRFALERSRPFAV